MTAAQIDPILSMLRLAVGHPWIAVLAVILLVVLVLNGMLLTWVRVIKSERRRASLTSKITTGDQALKALEIEARHDPQRRKAPNKRHPPDEEGP